MKEILIFCDRKTRFVVKYVSFAELNEKKKEKIVEEVANIERMIVLPLRVRRSKNDGNGG